MWVSQGSVLPACGAPRIRLRRFWGEREDGSRFGEKIRDGSCGMRIERCVRVRYGDGMMMMTRDAGATAAVIVGAYGLVSAFDSLTQRQILDQVNAGPPWFTLRIVESPNAYKGFPIQKLSRKIIHILSGILFMTSWPIFSSSYEARFFASLVPLLNGIRLVIYGFALVKNEGLIKSMTREGKPEELLKGPLYYVIVLMFCVLLFWRDSPVGIISLSMMSGGDGFADIMGRKYGQIKLPYNSDKSWVGSICMFASGFSLSMGMLYYFSSLGYLDLEWEQVASKVAIVSLAATTVESLPITHIIDDNISVPLCCILVASLLFSM